MTSGERSFAQIPTVYTPSELPKEWANVLVRTSVDQNIGLPDMATLTFNDPKRELLSKTGIGIGTPLKVLVTTVNQKTKQPLFDGEVVALDLDYDPEESYTVVRALSSAHRLFRNRRVLAFRSMTAEAVVRKVLSKAKVKPGRIELKRIVYPQISQAGETDWEFLTRLAAEHGATVRTTPTGQVDVAPPARSSSGPAPTASAKTNPLVLEFADNLRSLRGSLTSSGQVRTVEVRGWNTDTKKPITATRPATKANLVTPGLSMSSALGKMGASAELRTDRAYRTQAEVNAAAEVLAGSISDGQAEFEAVVDGNISLRANTPVALSGAGTAFSGRYTATSVVHILEPDLGYRTIVGVSATPDGAASGDVTTNPAGPRFPGVVTAVVTAIGGPSRSDPRGLVKLKFPWLDDTYESDWVRTMQFGGVRGGGVLSPDVNDEVLVSFDQGLLDRPYVVGCLYNGVDKPGPGTGMLVEAGRVRRRSLAARAGHRIELIDGRRDRGVLLSNGDDQLQIRINDLTGSIQLSANRTGGSIEISRTGITVDAGRGALTLRGSTVELAGTATVRIDGATVSIN